EEIRAARKDHDRGGARGGSASWAAARPRFSTVGHRLKTEHAGRVSPMIGVVRGVAAAVVYDDLAEIEGRHAFETGNIHAELVRVRTSFVMSVDAADGAEMMLRDLRVEPISGEIVFALRDAKVCRR